MTDTIEAVARAMCRARMIRLLEDKGQMYDRETMKAFEHRKWRECILEARAALQALHDNVSEEMFLAGDHTMFGEDEIFPDKVFQAMLTEAMKE